MAPPFLRAPALVAAALCASLTAACDGHVACIENVDPNPFYVYVVDANGNRLPGATATYSYEGGPERPCMEDSTGTFVCGAGSVGHYDITATLNGKTQTGGTDLDIGPCGPEAQSVTLTFE
jgi:hypothetical protein